MSTNPAKLLHFLKFIYLFLPIIICFKPHLKPVLSLIQCHSLCTAFWAVWANATQLSPIQFDLIQLQLKPVIWDSVKQSQHLVYTPMEEVHCTSARQGIIICQRPLVCWNKTCHLVFSGNGISNWRFDQIIYSCQNNKHLFLKKKGRYSRTQVDVKSSITLVVSVYGLLNP